MIWKKRNAWFGRYPACDMLNNALRLIFQDNELSKNELIATLDIIHAIQKGGGYFHEDLKEKVMMCLRGGFIIYGTKKD